jgi:hypothetical protein
LFKIGSHPTLVHRQNVKTSQYLPDMMFMPMHTTLGGYLAENKVYHFKMTVSIRAGLHISVIKLQISN